MTNIICIAILAVCLFGAYLLIERKKVLNIIYFGIIPIICFPFWMYNGLDWWMYYKTFWAAAFMVMIWIFKYTKFGIRNSPKYFVITAFILGVSADILKDIFWGNSLAHYINAVAGIALISTLKGFDEIRLQENDSKSLIWGKVNFPWILGFAIWQWTFVYLNYVEFASYYAAVFAVPLIVSLKYSKEWIQVYVSTLGIFIILHNFIRNIDYVQALNTPEWYNRQVADSAALITFIYSFVIVVFFAGLKIKKKFWDNQANLEVLSHKELEKDKVFHKDLV